MASFSSDIVGYSTESMTGGKFNMGGFTFTTVGGDDIDLNDVTFTDLLHCRPGADLWSHAPPRHGWPRAPPRPSELKLLGCLATLGCSARNLIQSDKAKEAALERARLSFIINRRRI